MIEINLIPDIKQEALSAQRTRNTVISASIIGAIAAGSVVVVLSVLVVAQRVLETTIRDNIKKEFSSLQSLPDINNALTIQNQLNEISKLNDKKTIDSRLFDVVKAISPPAPNNIKYSSIRLDPSTNTLVIEGIAEQGYPATETFRKLILNTKVECIYEGKATSMPLTSNVDITNASYGESSDGTRVLSFTVAFVYPRGLLDNSMSQVRVVTPTDKVDVTDSRTRVPSSLFGEPVKTDDKKGGN